MHQAQTKEKTFKLNSTLAGQTRALMTGMGTIMAATLMFASLAEGAARIQGAKEINKDLVGNETLNHRDKKDLAKDLAFNAVLFVAAFAIIWVSVKTLRNEKRNNDRAAIRVARRYLVEMRKVNPLLKKYDYILNNEMALYNIAAGITNKLSIPQTMGLGSYWDLFQSCSQNTSQKKVYELKVLNNIINLIVDELREFSETAPHFMGDLTALVDNSAKTFALDKYMASQKSR